MVDFASLDSPFCSSDLATLMLISHLNDRVLYSYNDLCDASLGPNVSSALYSLYRRWVALSPSGMKLYNVLLAPCILPIQRSIA